MWRTPARMSNALRRNPLVAALYVNAALLAVIALALLSRPSSPTLIAPAMGQAVQPVIAGGAGIFVVPAQFSTTTWGCYLMDVDQQTLCAYQYIPGEHQLRLMAARNFRYDRRLGNFNTANPSPAEVKELIEKEAAGTRQAPPAESK
jgi:hypothetical protein